MNTNKHIIRDKMNVKGETALGIILESQKSIASLREELHNRNIVVSGTKGKASGMITSADGYKANHDPTKNNLFILTNIANVDDFEIGDSIEFIDD